MTKPIKQPLGYHFKPCDRNIGELSAVVVGIGASQDDFSAQFGVRVAGQVEAEHRILK